jgi:hypothetical protein
MQISDRESHTLENKLATLNQWCHFWWMNQKGDLERAACDLPKPHAKHFNAKATIPFGGTVEHVRKSMIENSSIVGGFVCAALPMPV